MSKLGQNLKQVGDILVRPRLTEKTSALAERTAPVYTFEVMPTATKAEVKRAIKTLYQVMPVRVNTINVPGKYKLIRGRWGRGAATRKALVYLKAGEKLDIA